MLKKTTTSLMVALGFVLTFFLLQNCTHPIETESSDVQPALQESASPIIGKSPKVNLTFVNVDAAAGVQPYNTTISLNDPAGQVMTAGGNVQPVITTNNGLISLSIDESASYPYTFSIDISSPGFVPQTRTLLLSGKGSVANEVRLLEEKGKVEGVSVINANFPISGGRTSVPVNVSSQGPSNQLFSIRIPAGTTLLDANGKPVPGSNLSIVARYYASSSAQAMDAMPAPLNTPVVFGREGEPIASVENIAAFRTLGMVSVDMFAGNVEVKGFSTPIDFVFELDEQTTTGLNGQPLENGMTVDVWSFDEERDGWVSEGQSLKFSRNERERLQAVAKVIHLSTWNLDYKGSVCPSFSFSLNGPAGTYQLEIRSASNGQPVTSFAQKTVTIPGSGTETVTLLNLPADLGPLVIVVKDSNGNFLQSQTFNPCGSFGGITLGNTCFNPKMVTVVCSNGGSPAGIAIGYDTGNGSATNILGVTNSNGQFEACGILNGDNINLHAFVNSPLTINGYNYGGNGSNGSNFTVTASGNNLTITIPCP